MNLKHHLLDPSGAFHQMAQFNQFILWKSEERNGKTTKLPVSPNTMQVASVNDPNNHVSASDALMMAEVDPSLNVGFVFTPNDPFFFIDIDGALQNGQWSQLANELCAQFSGCAVEVSQSGKGLHIFGISQNFKHSNKNTSHHIELYTQDRFVALTGTNASGNSGFNASNKLAETVQKYFPHQTVDIAHNWTNVHHPESNPIKDDHDLLATAIDSQSATSVLTGRASFGDLFYRNVEVLAKTYPHNEKDFDESAADLALALHLSYWTGGNCERMKRLMEMSELKRDKWNRVKYIKDTILKAVSGASNFYKENKKADSEQVEQESQFENVRVGSAYMTVNQQIDYFKGCVYISQEHKILIPNGELLGPGQFKARYGGYCFSMSLENNKKETYNAWEAFTECHSYNFPKADRGYFDPKDPPANVKFKDGLSVVNTYIPYDIIREKGDITPFTTFLKKLLPAEHDRQILLAYMAALIQHQGVKFQWCTLLQGVEGNGKTLVSEVVRYCIGNRYSHAVRASNITTNFNAFMVNNIFLIVNDIKVDKSKRTEVMEILKPMITDRFQGIEKKGVDQGSLDIFANFMMDTNWKDAVPKTNNERRFAIFFTAQQHIIDIERDGMTGNYFPNLYKWLREGGYAKVAEFLFTYPIPDHLNPATFCTRAPVTTSTNEAIAESMGMVEQEILEAIEQHREGFRDGWVNGSALNHLLDSKRRNNISMNKRRELMETLGYVWHPGLPNGRATSNLPPDMNRPKLFIRKDSEYIRLTEGKDIVNQYNISQGHAPEETKDNIIPLNKDGQNVQNNIN